MKKHSRDKRSPVPKSASVSKLMSANKYKNSTPELIFRKHLWKYGLKGYRVHYKKVPGRPDFAFVSKKIAVFINGCYWHRCPHCNLAMPKNNIDFWKDKFERNVKRDKNKIEMLHAMGWKTITIWECNIKNNLESEISKVLEYYE